MLLLDWEREIGLILLLYGFCDEVNLFFWVFMGGVCNLYVIKCYWKIWFFVGFFWVDMEILDSEILIIIVLECLIKVWICSIVFKLKIYCLI